MSERKLASIQIISDIKDHPNADSLLIAKVLGWDVVISKSDNYKVGQKVVYFEIDSFLPCVEEYEFLRKSSYKNSPLLGEGFKLKPVKLRGITSSGLIMPIEVCFKDCMPVNGVDGFEVGEDVSELLNIKKWEDPEPAVLSGNALGKRPDFIIKTNETRIQSEPGLLEEFYNCPEIYISLKLDGSSHSIGLDANDVFHVTSHNLELRDENRPGTFYQLVKELDFEEALRSIKKDYNLREVAVNGEFVGPKIQNNKLGLIQPDWYVFNVYFDGVRQNLNMLLNICENYLKVKHVPIIAEYSNSEFKERFPDIESLLNFVKEYKTELYKDGVAEGFVIRPVEPVYSEILGRELSMKVINENYIL